MILKSLLMEQAMGIHKLTKYGSTLGTGTVHWLVITQSMSMGT